MSERFDELSRAMAGPQSRRGVLKLLGAAAAASVGAAVLKPFRGDAVCPAGTTTCGSSCCRGACSYTSGGSGCCCDPGTTPCGFDCCKAGIACFDRSRGVCGCPAGYRSCVSGSNLTCCPGGAPCGSRTCKSSLDASLGNYIKCSSAKCRGKFDTCFSTKQCCPGLTCVPGIEGFMICS
jgi:hypothetical protein